MGSNKITVANPDVQIRGGVGWGGGGSQKKIFFFGPSVCSKNKGEGNVWA